VDAIDWLAPHYVDARGRLRISVHALVVETPSRCIVVDTCVGNDKSGRDLPIWNGLQSSFMADFAAAGFAPERVDVVLCTHLHPDHVGWNTRLVDGKWLPTFPNARYLIGARELEHWRSRSNLCHQRQAWVPPPARSAEPGSPSRSGRNVPRWDWSGNDGCRTG